MDQVQTYDCIGTKEKIVLLKKVEGWSLILCVHKTILSLLKHLSVAVINLLDKPPSIFKCCDDLRY